MEVEWVCAPVVAVTEYAKADFDYDAQNEDELSFSAGDIIKIITKDYVDEGWWKGEFKGKVGVFPDNFCTVISVIPAQPEVRRSLLVFFPPLLFQPIKLWFVVILICICCVFLVE